MSLSDADLKALRALARGRSAEALKALFAAIRRASDAALLAAIETQAPAAGRRSADPLLRDVEAKLKPILAPAAEKADMLVEHMARAQACALDFEPRGLADALRRLRRRFTEDEIRTAAADLASETEALHGRRETIL